MLQINRSIKLNKLAEALGWSPQRLKYRIKIKKFYWNELKKMAEVLCCEVEDIVNSLNLQNIVLNAEDLKEIYQNTKG